MAADRFVTAPRGEDRPPADGAKGERTTAPSCLPITRCGVDGLPHLASIGCARRQASYVIRVTIAAAIGDLGESGKIIQLTGDEHQGGCRHIRRQGI
jgi:hypothetical protein